MLKILQEELPKLWTDELYSKQFKSSPSPYKDFDHALKHVLKAAGKLLEMTEEADHRGVPSPFEDTVSGFEGSKKYLADLVISTVRMALTCPDGPIDLEQAVLDRIERKMGKKIEIVTACEECGAVSQCNHHDNLGRCQCNGELGPCCKCS